MSTANLEPASYRYDEELPVESMMLEQLLKQAELQQLFQSFYELTRIPLAIIDVNGMFCFHRIGKISAPASTG